MLAAKSLGAKVPPDYVKPAPVAMPAAVPPKRLGEHRAAVAPQPQPAQPAEQHAAAHEAARRPLAVLAQHLDAATREYANAPAIAPRAAEARAFETDSRQPQGPGDTAHEPSGIERHDDAESQAAERDTRNQHEAAQARIRPDVGRECVR